jgi:hypothetical protein
LLGGRRPEALADFDAALRLDPQHAFAHDMRARVLTLLGRNDAAAAAAGEALRLAPESPTAHSARGWQLLHAGDRADAQAEFRESLRLNPESNWARLGLIESLKARNPAYRLLLRGLLRLGRVRPQRAWMLVAAAVGARVAGLAALDDPRIRPFVLPVVATIFAAMVLAWAARPLFNASLRLSRDGRHLLTAEERLESTLVAACIGGGALLALVWATTGADAFGLAAAAVTLLSLLVVIAPRRHRHRQVLWTLGALSIVAMLAGVAISLAYDGGGLPAPSFVPLLIAAPIFAALSSQWIGRPLLRTRRRPSQAPAALPAAPPRARTHSRCVAWPLTATGLVFGVALIGSLQDRDSINGGVFAAVGFAATFVVPALRPDVRRGRAAASPRTLIVVAVAAAGTAVCGGAAAATRLVPVEGAFVLVLFLLAAAAIITEADTPRRRKRLAVWAGGCALLVVTCGGAAVVAGSTHGPHAALTGPLAGWAGAGLTGLLMTPLLAGMRRPRPLAARLSLSLRSLRARPRAAARRTP